jgi:hypothetical protein
MELFFLIILVVVLLIIFKQRSNFKEPITVAVIALVYKPKNIETWLDLHRDFGISHFYIRLEDTPELERYLRSQPDVTLMVATSEKDSNQYTSLQTRQIETTNKVLKMCKETFLIHIDCDEVLSGDINEIKKLPKNVSTFWMQNHEAVYEDIPTGTDNCFSAKRYRNCKFEKCASYVNGKGGARVEHGVHLEGPHRFKGNGKEVKINVIVKHYESCDFEQYIKKYKRLSRAVNMDTIPFVYYRESILASGSEDKLKEIFKKYRT